MMMVEFKKVLVLMGLLSVMFYACKNSQKSEDPSSEGPRKVELKQTKGKYRLFVDGKKFFVKGAGLEFGNIEALAKSGANSFRTWRIDNGRQSGKEVLDEAYKYDLMVLMGIEVGRERHGYDYNDTAWVAQQKEEIRKQVVELKDHPALLGWGIGNELNLHYTNKKVWDAVDDIAKMIHEIDGNHPATTMLSGIGRGEVDYIEENCPNIDFLCVQFYGDIENLGKRIEEAGYEGPYLVTEWGATGHWEVPTTPWGAPIEQTSTEKAEAVKRRYENAILADSVHCMGSYVFLWGQKQERTPTWYGMFTEDGEKMESIDVMHYFWTGEWPENRAPKILKAEMNGLDRYAGITIEAGSQNKAMVEYSDPDDDSIVIECEIMREATDLGEGGDFESRSESVETQISTSPDGKISFTAPAEEGEYRLFIYVKDNHNHAGTVNIPFKVE
ncbi:MAG: glycoside hydrolase family 2 TIM barrel-domain containing protein [Bacteroidota bacterium]|nr:glycoside hydrolase family 2 TIM barrel-domain containing protein [Bacteroidota bacterium]